MDSTSPDDDRFARVGDDDLVITWHIQKHLMFAWEVDVEALDPFIPRELTPVEVRPGIGLISVATILYQPGNFGPDSPAFFELVSVAHVVSDLSVTMPVPRFSMHALNVWSNSPDFVRQEGELLFTPAELVPSLAIDFGAKTDTSDARDADGPIISLRNTHPEPVFAHDEMWGQHTNDTVGLHFGVWEWDGLKFEHQRGGDAGKLYPHRFWRGLDLSRVRGCYRQMIPPHGATAIERFYRTRQLRA
jgi:hypothetical protein